MGAQTYIYAINLLLFGSNNVSHLYPSLRLHVLTV